MKKYLIYAIPRTGSTFYSNLLNLYCSAITRVDDNFEFTAGSGSPVWDKPIHHTHQIDILSLAPDDYVKIVTTRSILDSTLSFFVANHTHKWHINTDVDNTDYLNKHSNDKINIDLKDFKENVCHFDYCYCKANLILSRYTGEKYILKYNEHTDPSDNYQTFYSALNITDMVLPTITTTKTTQKPVYQLERWVNSKMPIDKFLMIENLQQVLDAYKSCQVINDFDDQLTIDHVEQILKER
jgi:hypothetical protein